HALGIARELRREHLESNLALELQIAGAIHLSHPTLAEQREDFVMADAGSRWQSHAWDDFTSRQEGEHSIPRAPVDAKVALALSSSALSETLEILTVCAEIRRQALRATRESNAANHLFRRLGWGRRREAGFDGLANNFGFGLAS